MTMTRMKLLIIPRPLLHPSFDALYLVSGGVGRIGRHYFENDPAQLLHQDAVLGINGVDIGCAGAVVPKLQVRRIGCEIEAGMRCIVAAYAV